MYTVCCAVFPDSEAKRFRSPASWQCSLSGGSKVRGRWYESRGLRPSGAQTVVAQPKPGTLTDRCPSTKVCVVEECVLSMSQKTFAVAAWPRDHPSWLFAECDKSAWCLHLLVPSPTPSLTAGLHPYPVTRSLHPSSEHWLCFLAVV